MKASSNRATRPGPGRITQQGWDALIHPDDRAGNHQAYLRPAFGECDCLSHDCACR